MTEIEKSNTKMIEEIKNIIISSRNKITYEINNTMLLAYWNVGRIIVENEQNGNIKAEYGKQVIKELSKELRKTLGSGFSVRNLFNMRKIYIIYPKFQTLSRKLSWSHYCELLNIENNDERNLRYMRQFYEMINETKWSTMWTKLCWSHYREVLRLKDITEITYYLNECESKNLTQRQLHELIKLSVLLFIRKIISM